MKTKHLTLVMAVSTALTVGVAANEDSAQTVPQGEAGSNLSSKKETLSSKDQLLQILSRLSGDWVSRNELSIDTNDGYGLGQDLFFGIDGQKQDFDQAAIAFVTAAQQDVEEAALFLYVLYKEKLVDQFYPSIVPEEYESYLQRLRMTAFQAGHIAQSNDAMQQLERLQKSPRYAYPYYWHLRAEQMIANLGDNVEITLDYQLGMIYFIADFIPNNRAKSLPFIEQGMDEDKAGILALNDDYYKKTLKSVDQGLRNKKLTYIALIYEKIADGPSKDPHAAYVLAGMYERGEGVDKNLSKAYKYWELAAKGFERNTRTGDENKIALARLHKMYKEGLGVEQDDDMANYYMKKLNNIRSGKDMN